MLFAPVGGLFFSLLGYINLSTESSVTLIASYYITWKIKLENIIIPMASFEYFEDVVCIYVNC